VSTETEVPQGYVLTAVGDGNTEWAAGGGGGGGGGGSSSNAYTEHVVTQNSVVLDGDGEDDIIILTIAGTSVTLPEISTLTDYHKKFTFVDVNAIDADTPHILNCSGDDTFVYNQSDSFSLYTNGGIATLYSILGNKWIVS
jgi:hypothetical protein